MAKTREETTIFVYGTMDLKNLQTKCLLNKTTKGDSNHVYWGRVRMLWGLSYMWIRPMSK